MYHRIYLIIVCLMIYLVACDKKENEDPPPATPSTETDPDTVDTCDPDTVYFSNSVHPFLISTCAVSGCHTTGGVGTGLFDDYADVMNVVTPGDTANSLLVTVQPHPTDDSLTAIHMDSVRTWILQGALNIACP
jgi:hypothetical protein